VQLRGRWLGQSLPTRPAIAPRHLRLADDLIVEGFAGPNTVQIAALELND
jgi:hypothetical protein